MGWIRFLTKSGHLVGSLGVSAFQSFRKVFYMRLGMVATALLNPFQSCTNCQTLEHILPECFVKEKPTRQCGHLWE